MPRYFSSLIYFYLILDFRVVLLAAEPKGNGDTVIQVTTSSSPLDKSAKGQTKGTVYI